MFTSSLVSLGSFLKDTSTCTSMSHCCQGLGWPAHLSLSRWRYSLSPMVLVTLFTCSWWECHQQKWSTYLPCLLDFTWLLAKRNTTVTKFLEMPTCRGVQDGCQLRTWSLCPHFYWCSVVSGYKLAQWRGRTETKPIVFSNKWDLASVNVIIGLSVQGILLQLQAKKRDQIGLFQSRHALGTLWPTSVYQHSSQENQLCLWNCSCCQPVVSCKMIAHCGPDLFVYTTIHAVWTLAAYQISCLTATDVFCDLVAQRRGRTETKPIVFIKKSDWASLNRLLVFQYKGL